jgi:hypothetical protein
MSTNTIKTMHVKIRGVGAGLLMHSDRGMDRSDPLFRAMKENTSITGKKRTDEIEEQKAKIEFSQSFYFDEDMGPYIPAQNIESCLKEAAKAQKLGKEFTRSVMVVEDKAPLEYDGPKSIDGLWKGGFRDSRTVKLGQSRIIRTRPLFKNWSISFTVQYDSEFIDKETLDWAIETAGNRSGLGDFRPRFGRFERVE